MSAAICPSCGYDLEKDRIIDSAGLHFDPAGVITWHGDRIDLTEGERTIVASLAKAAGRVLSRDALIMRMGSDADAKIIDVFMCRLRQKFRRLGSEPPIETVWGRGYRWAAA